MNNIFIFTAGNPAARQHLSDSIINPIDPEKIFLNFPEDEHSKLKSIQAEGDGFYAWGAVSGERNVPTWESMIPGDYALCVYENRYHYASKILAKYNNEACARQIWGNDPNGNAFQYMYFLKKPIPINISINTKTDYLHAAYRGFVKISEDRISNILRDYGTVENFIETLTGDNLTTVNFWWVCQGESYTEDKGQKYIWAPLKDRSGGIQYHRDNVKKVKKGDIIFNYANGALRGVSIGKDAGYSWENDESQWDKTGTRVDIDHFKIDGIYLDTLKARKDDFEKVLDGISGPFDRNGDIKQGYLFQINFEAAKIIRSIYNKPFPEPIEKFFLGGSLPMPISERVKKIHEYISAKGFRFSLEDIANYYLCLKTKPFVILAGISGTGKTQLVRLFAEAINAVIEPIPVKPDWTDNSDLVGFKNLDKKFEQKQLIKIIADACKIENANKIFFVLLDEMNIARVEHYFSDFLSVIETRRKEDSRIATDKILHETEVGENEQELCNLYFPDNFYLVGTVNMDETTHPFSRKVLDRANSIELNEVHLPWHDADLSETEPLNDVDNSFLKARYVRSIELSIDDKNSLLSVLERLMELNDILKKADLQFGYRVRDEICFYMIYQKDISDILAFETALDFQIMQKILPRIQGSSQRIKRVIIELIKYLSDKNDISDSYNYEAIEKALADVANYPKSLNKLLFMLRRFEDDGFTSFWL